MREFYVEMITPERLFFKGDIEVLLVETVDGMMGFEAGHLPLVTAIQSGSISFLSKKKWYEVANGNGFVEIRPDQTVVLAQTLEWPHEIEENAVRQAIERAEEVMRQKKSQREYYLSKIAMAREFAKLKVKSHYK